ncbi:MAG: preprotein translocase subunit SecA [Bacteroidetes bacterium]|nr:preprotein translocase subunit SecA [Bacteroidota bacterium]
MLKLISKLVGSKSDRDLKKLQPYVESVNAFDAALKAMSNDQLRARTAAFKASIVEATAETKASKDALYAQIDATPDYDAREPLFEQIEALDAQELELIEGALSSIHPEAFGVVRETARRFNAGDVRATATELDRELAKKNTHITLVGDEVIYANSWKAAGGDITWNMVHYDVQLIGGTVLHQGKIAEMATGEGKTLVATLPVYLNALAGRGVHVVTVNDYLAKRDSEWMAPVFNFHGLTIDCIDKHPSNSEERRAAYYSDITYGTNNEFGFDYLRDNMARRREDRVQTRGHHFAIVDEVDSVLIDDARTPLIISGPTPKGGQQQFDELKPYVEALMTAQKVLIQKELTEAKKLISEGDTEEGGVKLLRAYRGLPKSKPLIKFLSQDGMKSLLQKTEANYMQEQGKKMKLIDEEMYFTIEEKNNQIDLSGKGVDLISKNTAKDFFVMPDITAELSALEDAGLSAEEKAAKKDVIMRDYGVKSERIHTVNQLLKAYALFEKDTEYVIMDNKVKIVDEQTGRIMEGRRYSDGLHQAIEAKESVKIEAATQTYATITLQNYFRMYHKLAGMTGTAETEAGEFWEIYELEVVVIPTNRPIARDDRDDFVYKTNREKYNAVIDEIATLRDAGRPILVGTTSVEISELLSRALKIRKVPHQVLNAKMHQKEAEVVAEAGKPGMVTIATNMAGRGTDIKLSDEAKAAGGLAIIGTERHDSRRVDRQLRGRAGRQGDVGSSQFFVSLEDKLMRLFNSERIAGLMDRLGLEEGEVIQHSMVSKSIERAQKKVEENNFGTRKRLLEYDDVMNSQRTVIYKRRANALSGQRIKVDIANMIYDTLADLVEGHQPAKDFEGFKLDFFRTFAFEPTLDAETFSTRGIDDLANDLFTQASAFYREKGNRIAAAALPVFKQVVEDPKNNFDKILVPITDGNKALQVTSVLEEVMKTNGQSLISDIEKGISIAIIDDQWKDHLRAMDDLRQSVQGAVYEQKDPLLIYKFESFELFKSLVSRVNQEIVSFLFRGDLPANDPSSVRQAPASQPKLPKLQESHPGADAPSAPAGRAPQQPRQKPAPVVNTGKTYGRNDAVTIVNMQSGEERNVKYKKAEPLLQQGWVIKE